ncbi:helix-turn-helix domain-containing protein [Sphaerimonospora thailandensis]|uniref:XRE family transcriptional regulator n=1 Tax=Sphaerimonospora thailandensis TaxID=795644 RepID=A0A8J3RCN3_9ACTN|nr:helix-turn-helix domain-containing protein [Sphaerimonospora thailandensis]GIH70093.1 XRE family transcriptional regulator [Sphaerimonospora thailandensis]
MVEPPVRSSLAEKIDRLFEVVLRPDREQYRNEEVASACREATGESFSATYLWQLRNGRRTNPTKRHLEALAQFFQVPPAYFFDDEQSERIAEELELLGALRDNAVRQIALRAVTLSPEGLDTISDVIEAIRRREELRKGPAEHDGD